MIANLPPGKQPMAGFRAFHKALITIIRALRTFLRMLAVVTLRTITVFAGNVGTADAAVAGAVSDLPARRRKYGGMNVLNACSGREPLGLVAV
jgi:hypothetical protein